MSRNLNSALAPILRGYLSGAILSTAGSSSTFGVSAGMGADSTNVDYINLTSAFTKTTAAWAVGSSNGALDTGAIAASSWYHTFLIKRPDTGVVDVLVSLSATAPTLPTNYTLFRRIGSIKTDGSGNWLAFTQVGDEFHWAANVVELAYSSGNLNTTSAVILTLGGVPSGVQVNALLHCSLNAVSTAGVGLLITSLDENDIMPDSIGGSFNCSLFVDVSSNIAAEFNKRTNTSAQIRYRATISGSGGLGIYTYGWSDRRGRDS